MLALFWGKNPSFYVLHSLFPLSGQQLEWEPLPKSSCLKHDPLALGEKAFGDQPPPPGAAWPPGGAGPSPSITSVPGGPKKRPFPPCAHSRTPRKAPAAWAQPWGPPRVPPAPLPRHDHAPVAAPTASDRRRFCSGEKSANYVPNKSLFSPEIIRPSCKGTCLWANFEEG